MTPVKLSGIGIGNGDIEYSFDNPKEQYPIKTAEDVKQYLSYAFFGNEALYKGEIDFRFECDGDDYYIVRDFGKNQVSLTVNGKKIPENEIDETIRNILRLGQGQWTEFVLASKHKEFDSAKENVRKFTEDVFEELKLSEETAVASAEEYRKEIESILNKIEVLNWINEDGKQLEDQLVFAADEIRAMEVDVARLGELVGMGNTGKNAVERKEVVKGLLAEEKGKSDTVEADKAKLEKSKAIKEHFTIVKAVAEAKEEIDKAQKDAAGKEESLQKLDAEIKTGKKVIKKKEKEFLEANARVKALNEAFDEMIKANKEEGKGDASMLEAISAFCKEGDETLVELMKIRDELEKERKTNEEAIAAAEEELSKVRPDADYRKAVREGACFEIALEEKRASLDLLEKTVEEDEKTVKSLLEEKQRHELALGLAREDFARLFGEGDKQATLRQLIDDYNDLERVKQSLYRNQILSATLLQEINAIDKKIGDNTERKRNCLENKQALDNAKETLVAYMAKCDEALAKKEEELSDLEGRKKFFEDLDSLPYGSKCPVCSAPISHKKDGEKAAAALVEKETELKEEVARLKGIRKEYTDKLDAINLRLGSFESTIASSTGYIESLEQTKLAKMTALKNIYKENQVKDHEELTADLEKAIAEIAQYGASILDVKAIVATEETSATALERIETRLNELQNEFIPERKAKIAALEEEIKRFETGKKGVQKPLNDKKALSLLDETIRNEQREDALQAQLTKLYAEKKKLDERSDELNADVAIFEGRKYPFKKDGKEYDYTALCLNVAAERYDEVVGAIRAAEAERQKVQDEYVAITRMVKDRQERADGLKADLEEAYRCKEVKSAYVDTLVASESQAATVFAGTTYESVKNGVLADEEEERIAKEIADYEEAVAKYEYELAALDEVIVEAQEAYEGLDGNVAASNELNAILHDRMEEYVALSNKVNLSKVLSETIADLDKAHADARKRLNDVSAVIDGHAADLLVTKINNALNVLMPKIRVKVKDEGLAVISTGRGGVERELERIEDDEYVCVSISIINAVKQVVAEVINSSATIRIVRVRTNLVKDETKAKIKEFAENNNLIVIFHK